MPSAGVPRPLVTVNANAPVDQLLAAELNMRHNGCDLELIREAQRKSIQNMLAPWGGGAAEAKLLKLWLATAVSKLADRTPMDEIFCTEDEERPK